VLLLTSAGPCHAMPACRAASVTGTAPRRDSIISHPKVGIATPLTLATQTVACHLTVLICATVTQHGTAVIYAPLHQPPLLVLCSCPLFSQSGAVPATVPKKALKQHNSWEATAALANYHPSKPILHNKLSTQQLRYQAIQCVCARCSKHSHALCARAAE
jgi:hypothetical protein